MYEQDYAFSRYERRPEIIQNLTHSFVPCTALFQQAKDPCGCLVVLTLRTVSRVWMHESRSHQYTG